MSPAAWRALADPVHDQDDDANWRPGTVVPDDMDDQGWFQLDLGNGVIKDVQAPEGLMPGDVTVYLLRYLQISYLLG